MTNDNSETPTSDRGSQHGPRHQNRHENKQERSFSRNKPYSGAPKKYGKPKDAKSSGPRPQANIWGTHAVTAAWLNPDRVIKKLYVTETMRDGFAAVLKEGRNLNRPEPTVIDKRQLDNALKKAVHQGIAIDAAPLDEVFVSDIIAKLSTRKSGLILMLDHVTDPHNVGAILRSACAFGADGVIMQRKFSPELTGVLAKTATGAVEHMPVAFEINLSDTLDTLAAAGFYAIGLDERGPQTLGEAVAAYKGEEHLAKTVLVLGAEGSGLRPKVRDHCSALARLPTGGPIESLNVSNAAAIALYALSER